MASFFKLRIVFYSEDFLRSSSPGGNLSDSSEGLLLASFSKPVRRKLNMEHNLVQINPDFFRNQSTDSITWISVPQPLTLKLYKFHTFMGKFRSCTQQNYSNTHRQSHQNKLCWDLVVRPTRQECEQTVQLQLGSMYNRNILSPIIPTIQSFLTPYICQTLVRGEIKTCTLSVLDICLLKQQIGLLPHFVR